MNESPATGSERNSPRSAATGPKTLQTRRSLGGTYRLEASHIATYTVVLEKTEYLPKYGIAYKVFNDNDVIITGILLNTIAAAWNGAADASAFMCAGDVIVEANQQTAPRSIVKELRSSEQIVMKIQKTGPRWHLIGEGAERRVAQPKGLSASPSLKSAVKQPLVAQKSMDEIKEPMPLGVSGWIYLFAAVLFPNLMILALYSDVGFGLNVHTLFAPEDRNMQGNGIVFMGSMAAVGLVVFDWTHWTSKMKRILAAAAVTYTICGGAFLKSRFYPVAPLVVIFFHIPLSLGVLKSTTLKMVYRRNFYIGVTTSAISTGLLMLTIWLLWMNVDAWDGTHLWGDDTKERLVMDSEAMYDKWMIKIDGSSRSLNYFWDCSPRYKQLYEYEYISTFRYMDGDYKIGTYLMSSAENEERGGACARVKTVWFLTFTAPMICMGLDFIIGIFCLVNGVFINVTDTSKLEKVLKQFILMISFLVFTMYVSTSVAGASMKLTGVIMAFCASGLIALCVWLYIEIGRSAITSQVRNSKLMQSLIVLATSDWVRACVLIGLNVLIPSFVCVNMINQWVRKRRGRVPRNDPKYTATFNRVMLAIQDWNWASILIKANWLVILYWTFSVGVAKLTYVFLSWLNERLLQISFVAVLFIFFVIGFTMFMLPPVPGIPVYITSGIILSARARNIPEAGYFWGGMGIAVFESLVLKICAVCGQYMIGYFMGKSVKVQQLVAVDKVFTRAIEQILDTRGLNLPKVSVLVGGPDWPTSVLCGILKLNLFQCCLGTLPVIFVSAPCVVAGAFLSNPGKKGDDAARRLAQTVITTTAQPLEKQQDETWQTLSTTALAMSFMLQLAGMVLALYYIQEVVHNDGEELGRPRVEHEAVAALTRKEADYVAEYNNAIAWRSLMVSRKRLILASTCAMLMSTFMFVMMDEACFRPFQVSSRISDPYDEEGLNGNVLNLVMPLGWFATGCFFFASSLHYCFLRWAKAEADKRLQELIDSRPPPLDEEDE